MKRLRRRPAIRPRGWRKADQCVPGEADAIADALAADMQGYAQQWGNAEISAHRGVVTVRWPR